MVDRPEGRLFSELYMDRPLVAKDSQIARARLNAWLNGSVVYDLRIKVAQTTRIETGYFLDSTLPLKQLPIAVLLNFVTLAARTFRSHGYTTVAASWGSFVDRVFRELNMPYEVDAKGGVHRFVDPEFGTNLAATIRGLDAAKFSLAKEHLIDVQRALDRGELRLAVEHAFDANENVFKVLSGKHLLGTGEAKAWLAPKLATPSAPASHASAQMQEAFLKWIAASHNYRHAPGQSEPAPPPPPLAVLMISQGAAFLRWILDLEATASPAP